MSEQDPNLKNPLYQEFQLFALDSFECGLDFSLEDLKSRIGTRMLLFVAVEVIGKPLQPNS
ncbi:MAG: hypothetical protein LLG04_16490 [Parachlamydia sp.]|nr:hypothetical protein [Parachlamydia sp.]